MKIGVIGFQGAVTEHIISTRRAMGEKDINGEVIWLKEESMLSEVDGLIIPGGESTTIGSLISDSGMFEGIKKLGKSGTPIFGTCAGLILLAKEDGGEVQSTNQPLLELMDMRVIRNAFGRQKESFEADLDIPRFGREPFPGVFIRAPAIERTWGKTEAIARCGERMVAAEQNNYLAMAFHPELTNDLRAHKYYLDKVEATA